MNNRSFFIFKFLHERACVAALEFALIAPLLIVVFLGVYEVADYVRATMRTDQTAQSVAQLIAAQAAVTNPANPGPFDSGTLTDYCWAAHTVIAPYNPANLTLQIASYTLSGAVTSEDWGVTCPPNDTTSAISGFAPGVPISGLLLASGDSVIVVKASYQWAAPDGGLFLHSIITASETVYARPRSNKTITCSVSNSTSC